MSSYITLGDELLNYFHLLMTLGLEERIVTSHKSKIQKECSRLVRVLSVCE